MQDLIYIPERLANHLLFDIVPWEHVESIISLLSMATFREPFEQHSHISKYAIKAKDVRTRFTWTTPFDQYGFSLKDDSIPYIGNFHVSPGNDPIYAFYIHDLCNPKYYSKRHKYVDAFKAFPVTLWRMPRHVLTRWRYSCKMPIHQSSLLPKKRLELKYDFIKSFDEAIQQFSEFTKMFFRIMCSCDESSIPYSFCCFVYFFIHDKLLNCLKSSNADARVFNMLAHAYAIVKQIVFIENTPMSNIETLASYFKGVLPPSVYGSQPFSLFSENRI